MSALADYVDAIGEEAARRCDRWEVLAIDRADSVVEFGSGTPDASRASRETSVCLRVLVAGRVGTATTTRLDRPQDLTGDAILSARFGPRTPWPDRPPEAPGRRQGEASTETAAELAREVCGLQRSTGLDVHGTVTRTRQRVRRADRHGGSEDDETFFHLAIVAEGRRNPRLQLPWTGWTRTAQLPGALSEWLTTAAAWDNLPADVAPPPTMGVLLGPAAVHSLLTPLVVGLSATTAASGRSFADLGETLLHRGIDIRDEPVPADTGCDGSEGLSYPAADDNGVPAAPLTVVENGAPARLYHSVRTAADLGVAPTGHGFRGNAVRRKPLQPVTPVLNNATLHADGVPTAGLDDLITDLDSGVFIDSLLGGQQRAGLSPVVEGRIRLGFVVEHGKVVGTMTPAAVALDLREILGSQLAAVSARRWAVSRTWSGRLPFVLARRS